MRPVAGEVAWEQAVFKGLAGKKWHHDDVDGGLRGRGEGVERAGRGKERKEEVGLVRTGQDDGGSRIHVVSM